MHTVLNGLKVLIIADAVFSWLLSDTTFPRTLTKMLLDPVYSPVRSLLRPLTGPIDLAPLIAFGLLHALQLVIRDPPGN